MLPFIILLALPFASINAGAAFLAERNRAWENRSLENSARRELEALTNSAAFQQHLERSADALLSMISRPELTRPGLPAEDRSAFLEREISRRMGIPTPPFDLWLFEDETAAPGDRPPRVVIASSSFQTASRGVATAFTCLAHYALESRISPPAVRRGEKLIATLFGSGQSASHLALSQRGITTQVIHDHADVLLIWNGIRLSDGRRRGFFLLFRDKVAVEKAGMQAALLSHHRRGGRPAGFVKTLRSGVPDLLAARLGRSESFRRWRKSLRPHSQLPDWQMNGTPWNVRLEEGRLFTRHMTEGRHMAVLLLPGESVQRLPLPVFLLNILVCGGGLLVLTRGILLGAWPVLPFGIRFSALFSASALLPISLLLIGSLAFNRESANSERNALTMRIKSALEGIDSARERLSGSFHASFLKLLQQNDLRARLTNSGMDAPGILDFIISHFRDEKGRPQHMFVALMDSNGKMRVSPAEGYTIEDMEGMVRFCSTGLLRALRSQRIKQAGPASVGSESFSVEDKAFITTYESATGNTLMAETEQKRSIPFDCQIGRRNANMLFDFVPVKGIDTYAIIVGWNADDLSRSIIQNSMLEAQLRIPNAVMAAFSYRHGRVVKFTPPSRHETPELMPGLLAVARKSARRNGSVIETDRETACVALPLRGFSGIILSAAADTRGIRDEESMNQLLVGMLATLCAMLVLLSGRITARRMLGPIRTLREALEKVGHGDLTVALTDERPDELGRLSVAFGNMVAGLRERRQLATLVSDHAIATLESAADPGLALSATSFHGIILISDIRGFTPLCETRQPGEITDLLMRHFAGMAPLIIAEGGRIDKFIGDAIQAVFIEVEGRESAVIRAIRAGKAMQAAIEAISRERVEAGLFPYQAGVGIAGGRLLSGAIGHPSTRLDYALLGPAIARAADLDALTKLVPRNPIAVDAALAPLLGPFAAFAQPIPGNEDSALAIIISDDILRPAAQLDLGQEKNRPGQADTFRTDTPDGTTDSPVITSGQAQAAGGDTAIAASLWYRQDSRRMRLFAFILGLLFLAMPFASLIIATDPHLNGTLDRILRETTNAHEAMMTRLGITNPDIHLLEDRMGKKCEELCDTFQSSDPETGGPARERACEEFVSHLASLGFKPSLAAVLYRFPGKGPASWPLAFCVGDGAAVPRQFLRDLLAKGTCDFEEIPANGLPNVNPGVPAVIGKQITMGPLESNYMNRAMPSTRNGENIWFYWRPLLKPPQITPADFATSASVLSPGRGETRNIPGFLLLHLPRRAQEDFTLTSLLSLLSAPSLELRITERFLAGSASDSETVFSPGYPGELPASSTGLVETPYARYVISANEAVISGRHLHITFASRIGSPAEESLRHFLFIAALVLCFLFLAGIWHRTVFRRGGFATSLFSQLLVGFLAAALLPFSAILAGTARFAAEDIQTRVRNERFDLVQKLDDLDRLHMLQFPFVWDRIERLCFHPNMLKAIRRYLQPPSQQPTVGEMPPSEPLTKMLRAIKAASRKGSLPYYVTQIMLSSPNGVRFELEKRKEEADGSSIVTFYLSNLASLLFTTIGDRPAETGAEGPLGDAVKREMAIETGFSVFRSVFIPELSYRTLYSSLAHVILPGGNGVIGFSNILLPDAVHPRGFISLVYAASQLEMNSLNRITHTQTGRFALFGSHLQHCANMIKPGYGGALPQLAGPARWTHAGSVPMSFRIETGETSLLVETKPGVFNPRVFLAAVAAEAPLQAAARNVQTGLFLWMALGILATLLLAWRSAVDLITPIRGLEAGMRGLSAGRFETRIGLYRTDEIGDLQRAFDRMVRSLQERELIRTMMSSQARKSAGGGGAVGEKGEDLPGERIDAVIVMTGVPGFKARVETISPERLFQALTAQTSRLCDLFIEAGGDVDKVIGEKMLIVFRGGSQRENAARLLDALRRLAGAMETNRLPFPVSVGISAGPVISGFVGSGSKRDHTVIGDTVNTAARLLTHADKLDGTPRIVCSGSCRDLLPAAQSCEHLGSVSLKGKTEPLAVFRLLP